MIFTNKENEKIELPDGRTIWLSRAVAVVVTVWCVVKDTPYLLIGQRGPGCPDEVGKWNLPCGYLDWDEDLKGAATREVWEETGLDIKNVSKRDIMISHMDMPWVISSDPASDGKQNISHHYALVVKSNELPTLSSANCEPGEISDLKWIGFSDINDYDYAFGHDIRIKEFINKEKIHNWV